MGARDIRQHRNKVARIKIKLNTELSLCMPSRHMGDAHIPPSTQY
jgi:hypothetical protein